jgi:FOG: HEAT repeat
MIAGRFWGTCLFFLFPGFLLAGGDISIRGERNIRVIMTGDTGAELRLEARQAPLDQVLNEIASKTGVPVHYSILPEGLVTATCVGTTVKQVVECLLGPKVDLVIRYPRGSSKADPHGQPAEVWVLGSSFGRSQTPVGVKDSGNCTTAAPQEQAMQRGIGATNAQTDPTQTEPDETDTLVEMAKAKNPAQRAAAISRLATEGRADDVTVRKALEAALADKDANVRAQAISSLARRDSEGAATVLQQALHDSDASVRLMAVSSAGDDAALLQQALTDSDETVRALAARKLELLSKTDTVH